MNGRGVEVSFAADAGYLAGSADAPVRSAAGTWLEMLGQRRDGDRQQDYMYARLRMDQPLSSFV